MTKESPQDSKDGTYKLYVITSTLQLRPQSILLMGSGCLRVSVKENAHKQLLRFTSVSEISSWLTQTPKLSFSCAAPAAKQTVDGKRVAAGGPGQGRAAAKRVSVATPKAREAAAAAKKPVGRPRKGQAE